MRRLAVFTGAALCAIACATPNVGTENVHGAIAIEVVPNPVIAKWLGQRVFEFPYTIVLRETAGRGVKISKVATEFHTAGGVRLPADSFDLAQLTMAGLP